MEIEAETIDLEKYYKTAIVDDYYTVRYVKVGNGPEVIFGFPGLLGSVKVSYIKLIELFEKEANGENRYTFYSWDQPGYYGSQPPERKMEDITFGKDVDLAYSFLNSLGHLTYSLIGWSAGGQLSLLFAIKYPQMVKRLMIWGAWDRFNETDLKSQMWFRNLDNLEPTFLAETIKDNGQGREGYEKHWHAWVDQVKTEYDGSVHDEVTWIKRFEKIVCPTLIIWGSRDTIVPFQQAKYLHNHIKNSRLLTVPKAPHWIQTVFANVLFNHFIDFVAETSNSNIFTVPDEAGEFH